MEATLNRPLSTGLKRRLSTAAKLLTVVLGAGACTTTAPAPEADLRISSDPPGALVTLSPDEASTRSRTVIGVTPVDCSVPIPAGASRLSVEKRGYFATTIPIPVSGSQANIELEPNGAATKLDVAVTGAETIALLGPMVEIIHRRFASEEVSPEDTRAAGGAITAAVEKALGQRPGVVRVSADDVPKAFMRDARASAALLDPVRLPFLPEAPRLETSSGRSAARQAGDAAGARPLLLISGRSSLETGGMKAGKLGIMAVGTAASFASGYGQALSSGDSFFTYNIYLPSNTEGSRLDAVLVDAATGDVLWVNRGIYPPLDLEHPSQVAAIISDLLTGLPVAAANNSSQQEGDGGS